ncbi:MAG TPA: HD domain-containing phosphohydrolase [Patescibacteria group bacterium]|nr:HD domain-containing phosphohydrolase [Patescibacteria group bacterium]
MNTKNYLSPTKRYKLLISAVHSVYRLISSTFELKDLFPRLARLLCQIFNACGCEIVLFDSTSRYSVFRCEVGERKKYISDKKKRIIDRLEKNIAKRPAVVRNAELLAVPLICEDSGGVIIVKRKNEPAPFESFDQEVLMTLAEQVIVAIRNLQLVGEQQKIILGSIKSLVTLLDMRVPQEYAHSPYFRRLVMSIAQQMHLDPKQIESLKYASLLHDAGKIDIPPEILSKTSKLTPREYKIVKRHPARGAQILRSFQILKPVIPIIMHHHEKYDGTGYPSRLKKGQIPEGARVMAVADAFEAMVYGRPYRERKDILSAVREIKKKSGTQFDPRVVEAFLRVVKKIDTKKYLQRNE